MHARNRLRQMDVKAEHFERQVARIEQERDQWEAKFEEAQGKYLTSKRELEELAQQVSRPSLYSSSSVAIS
jgi:tropomyosin